MIWHIITLTLICFFSLELRAEEIESIKIENLAKKAIENSRLLAAKDLQILAKRNYSEQATAFQNPQLSFSIGKRESQGGSFSIPYSNMVNGEQYQFGISQPFYFPGKRDLQKKIFEKEGELSEIEKSELELEIYYTISFYAYETFVTGLKEKHARERARRFRMLQGFLRSRPFASPMQKAQKTIAENKLKILESQIVDIQYKREILKNQIRLYTEVPEKFSIQSRLFSEVPDLNKEELFAEAKKNSLILKKLNKERESKDLQAKYSAKQMYPDITVSGFFGKQTLDNKETYYGLGLDIPIPILNQNKAKIKGLEQEISSYQIQYEFEEQKLEREIGKLFLRYTAAKEKIKLLSPNLLEAGHRQMNYADSIFRRGLIGFTDYLNAESEDDLLHKAILGSHLEMAGIQLQAWKITGKINPITF